jgi:uncharacterized protein (DUF2267 family)
MSATGLDVFDKTVQSTNIWLDEIMNDLGPDRQFAWHVLGAVLHCVRDRLPIELAAHLGAQLPLLIRGLYYDQWQVSAEPARWRSLDEFTERLGQSLKDTRRVNRLAAAEAVFATLSRHLSAGQVDNVRDSLPPDVRALWRRGGVAGAENARRAG